MYWCTRSERALLGVSMHFPGYHLTVRRDGVWSVVSWKREDPTEAPIYVDLGRDLRAWVSGGFKFLNERKVSSLVCFWALLQGGEEGFRRNANCSCQRWRVWQEGCRLLWREKEEYVLQSIVSHLWCVGGRGWDEDLINIVGAMEKRAQVSHNPERDCVTALRQCYQSKQHIQQHPRLNTPT